MKTSCCHRIYQHFLLKERMHKSYFPNALRARTMDTRWTRINRELRRARFMSNEGQPQVSCFLIQLAFTLQYHSCMLSNFSPVETISLKIRERPLSWHAKHLLPVFACGSKTRVSSLIQDFNLLHFLTLGLTEL